MSIKNGNGILALLAGAAIGVGLGILFAPDKGSKTREKIKDGFDDLKDKAKSKMDFLDDETKAKISSTKEELKDKVESLLSDSSYKAEEAITFLEEKLAELKKQNAKLQK
ncbi:MAG TPA: YtxH domain-containing protein [Flavobacterium sp.]|uniref:YtxH domain-containing protein n=1 Tax=Flavobacterium sp. TaxID=239 RepID=UPI002BF9BFAF|nr:YtxH domain-containing protein [Flavobacterium sp.]HNP32053.1 YtxH domain-containing protein [Flavobacterium sp.]